MLQTLRIIAAPILSLFAIMLGNGLFMTLISVRLKLENFSPLVVGFVTASFFAGLVLGSLRMNKLIERIGHIRAFSLFASMTTALVMLQGIFINPFAWGSFRFFAGIATAGLYITVESWLLAFSTPRTKGRILSIYMIAFYGSQAAGQYFLTFTNPLAMTPFAITAVFCSFSILPVAFTKFPQPATIEPSILNIFHLIKIVPLGVISCFASGFILGTTYGLLPVYAQGIGMSIPQVAQIIGLTIFGGLILQWPIGYISDFIDRRKVILFVSLIFGALSIFLIFSTDIPKYLFLILITIFGGFSFTIFPLSVSHTSDMLDPKDFVAGMGALNLAFGVGAIIGPIIASYGMNFGYSAFFIYYTLIAIILAIYTLFRIFQVHPVPVDEKQPYRNLPRTTTLTGELDPRSETPKP